ncbi:MAG: hypothetical protein H7256_09430 [Bdellovibrio sp.]|nr:hypothetical protein [Bdellovibrio sp.]
MQKLKMIQFVTGVSILLVSTFSFSQEVPMISQDPAVDRTFEPAMFDFVATTLSGKLASFMGCSLKTKFNREIRTFSTGPEWVETLAIDFRSGNNLCPGMSFKFPITAKYGFQKSANHWSGLGEEFKIEAGDVYGHWLKFTHDGKGHIVQLTLGNDLRVCPCHLKSSAD